MILRTMDYSILYLWTWIDFLLSLMFLNHLGDVLKAKVRGYLEVYHVLVCALHGHLLLLQFLFLFLQNLQKEILLFIIFIHFMK
jgi:hypothetical protein